MPGARQPTLTAISFERITRVLEKTYCCGSTHRTATMRLNNRNRVVAVPVRSARHGRLVHNFVLMPHARRIHQPRTASNNMNPPETFSARDSGRFVSQNVSPTITRITPPTARMSRPRALMFREKNRLMQDG